MQFLYSGPGVLQRFARLASWSLVSFALEKGAMIIVIFLLARILGAEDYGRLTLAQGLVNSLQIFVVLGVGTVLSRYIPKMREEGVQRAVEIVNLCAIIVMGTGVLVLLFGLLSAQAIARQILDLSSASTVPYWMLAWVILSAASSLLLTVMLAFERGRVLGVIAFVGAGLSIVLVPLLADGLGVAGAIAGLVTVEFVKTIALAVAYGCFLQNSGVRIFSPIKRSDMPLLFNFGLPTFLISALWGPTMWFAQIIVKTFAPDGLAAVGVFAFTNNIFGAVIVISSLTNRAALPIMASLQARGAYNTLRRMAWLMASAQAGAAAVIGLPMAIASPFIMAQAGPEFASVWPVLLIMIATGVILAGQTALGNYLLVLGKPYFLLGTMVAWTAIVLTVIALSINFGAYSLAWALLIGAIVRTLIIMMGSKAFADRSSRHEAESLIPTLNLKDAEAQL